MKFKDVNDLRDYFILSEVEYCFDNNYSRCEEVIGHEYDCLNESYEAYSKYEIDELIREFGEDIIEIIVTPYRISDTYKNELIGFITECKTATVGDKEKAISLVNTIVKENHRRNA